MSGSDRVAHGWRAPRVLTAGLRVGARLFSPRDRRARLLILAYHRVLPAPDPMRPYEVDVATFARHMDVLSGAFRVMSLGDAIDRLAEDRLPSRAACVTFDDGYADNHDVALPVLRHYRLPATFFVAAGYLDGGLMWNDAVIEAVRQASGTVLDLRPHGLDRYELDNPETRARAARRIVLASRYLPLDARSERVRGIAGVAGAKLPGDLMMSSEQVRALASAGFEVGGHTVSHPILARLAPEQAWHEIHDGKQRLQDVAGASVRVFAYPNGRPDTDYSAAHVEMVRRAGFVGAVTTAWGAARAPFDRYQLPRIMPWDHGALRIGWRLMQAYRGRAEVCADGPEAA